MPRRGSLLYKKNVFRVAVAALPVCAAMVTAYADTTIAENITLNADTDWRADGVVTVPEGVTVDLNGHTLWVSGLSGKGAFTSSVAAPATFDLTTADASKVSTTTTFYSGTSAANLFNNNYDRGQPTASNLNSRRVIVKNENLPIIVDYDFGAATVVNSYKVYAGGYRGGTDNQNSGHERTAKRWKFYGSNDEGEDKEWDELDENSVTDWNDYTAPDSRQFTFFNATAYRYYRMEILEPQKSSNGYTELVQLEYGYVPNQVRIVPSLAGGFASASNTVSGTAKFVVAGGALAANADLRGLGKISVAPRETLDLAGHYLQVHAIDGAARVTTSVTATFLDLTTPAAAKTSATATSAGTVLVMAGENKYPASAAFDDSLSTSTSGSTANPCHFAYYASFPSAGIEINYDFGAATYVNTYKICGTCNSDYSIPKTWAFQGSNDGVTWTTLDERANQALPLSAYATYTFISDTSYSRYRLRTTAATGNRFYLFELQYGAVSYNAIYVDADGIAESDFSAIALSDGASFALPKGDTLVLSDDLDLSGFSIDDTIDLHGNTLTVDRLEGNGAITDTTAFDLTDTDVSRVWSPNTYYSANAGVAKDAFANQIAPSRTGIRVMAEESQLPVVIDYDFRTATVVDQYLLTSGDNVSRAPGAWEIYGSNDDAAYQSGANDLSAWTRLDRRLGERWTSTFETRAFGFTNTTACRYYRIRFTGCATAGNGYLTFWKLQYGCSANCGHLRVAVPSGSTIYNRSVSLAGNLRLVKDGLGTFVPAKANQSYRCGTEVANGMLTLLENNYTLPLGMWGSEVFVRSGTSVILNGKVSAYWYGFTLDGGTMRHVVAKADSETAMLKRVRLTGDSTLLVDRDYGLVGLNQDPTTLDLGGNTLEVQIEIGQYFRCYNTTILDGTVDITSGGWFLTGGGYVKATNVDFKINCALDIAAPFSVGGYEAKFYSTGSNNRTEPLTVAGVFKPTVAAYYGCTMLAGSTMDLTAWPSDAGWPMASAFGANGKTDLEFADSGEIAVNLAGRTDLKALARSADSHLFTWPLEDGVPVVPGAGFVLDPVTASAGFKVKKDATGLRLIYGKGFMLIVR